MKYKVIGRKVGVYDVPVDALELSDDIHRIKLAMDLLGQVSELHITPGDAEFGWKLKSVTISQIRMWHRYAQQKLRKEYLAR